MAEAEEATDSTVTEDTQTETSAFDGPQETPDVGEALQQMSQRFDRLEERLPEPETEDAPDLLAALTAPLEDDYYDDRQQMAEAQQPQQPQEQQFEQGEGGQPDIRQMLNEAVQEQVLPLFLQQEADKRADAIRGLQTKYPNFTGEAVDAVSAALQSEGLMPENGMPPSANVVETYYKAYEADRARKASEESTAEAATEGATIETGAGPGVPEDPVDPATDRWAKALEARPRDAFS